MNTTYDAKNNSPPKNGEDLNSTYTKPIVNKHLAKANGANTTYTAEEAKDEEEETAPHNPNSYDITPARHELPPEELDDPNNYDIKNLKSDEETDDEDQPRKIVPSWAQGGITLG